MRETLRGLVTTAGVDRGESFDRRMFTGGTDRSRTNPDLVLHDGSGVRAAGDVKYKTLRVALGEEADEEEHVPRKKKEGRPDLYQVLMHAASLSAPRAFLVYVSDDSYVSRYLGQSATGCATWTVQVRPQHLKADLERFLEESAALQS